MNTTKHTRDKAAKAAHEIITGFTWSQTDEGTLYWQEVHSKLTAIVREYDNES